MIWIVSSVPVFAYDGVTVLRIEGDEELIRERCEDFFNKDILATTNGNFMNRKIWISGLTSSLLMRTGIFMRLIKMQEGVRDVRIRH